MEHDESRFVLERKSRLQLQQLIADGNTPQKIVKRARIIVMTADGHGVMAIMREVGVSRTTVWRWQEYFAEAGVEGLVKGRSKPPGRKPISAAIKLKVVEKTVEERPVNATNWNDPTTPFAALHIGTGKVIGECLARHRADEFLAFLKKIDRETPAHLDLHLILDNYATHKTPAVKRWLARHKRFILHFTPTSCSWLNLV